MTLAAKFLNYITLVYTCMFQDILDLFMIEPDSCACVSHSDEGSGCKFFPTV